MIIKLGKEGWINLMPKNDRITVLIEKLSLSERKKKFDV